MHNFRVLLILACLVSVPGEVFPESANSTRPKVGIILPLSGKAEEVNRYLHSVSQFRGKIGVYGALPHNSFDVPAGLGEIKNGQILKTAQ